MNKNQILVVDDEPDIRELLSITLRRMGHGCDSAENLQQGKALVDNHDYHMVLTDMRLPDGDGISLVEHIQKTKPFMPVAVITAFGNVEGAVNSLKAGAFDYVSKPIDMHVLKNLVNAAMTVSMEQPSTKNAEDCLIGKSPAMKQLREQINKVARSQAPVFIRGASGSGKEIVARMIHASSPRKDMPFIPVNCGAIPSELVESEFFGHKKGSFTGAIQDKDGLFVAAHQGTLFLDEIAELPLQMQVKLLRAIQEKAIKPVGGISEKSVDVRILSASHKDLLKEVNEGRFRQDLFYRVNVIEIKVPDLKERLEDVPLLAEHILSRFSKEDKVSLSNAAIKKLQSYDYPGNVRELENILERALAMGEGSSIEPEDLQLPQTDSKAANPQEEIAASNNLDDFLLEQEKEQILEALDKTRWNRTAAARLLGISFRTLRYRLKKLNID